MSLKDSIPLVHWLHIRSPALMFLCFYECFKKECHRKGTKKKKLKFIKNINFVFAFIIIIVSVLLLLFACFFLLI